MAEDLGKRLLAEVEEVGIGAILQSLRLRNEASHNTATFELALLDRLLQIAIDGRPQPTKAQPIVEIMSLHSGAGATHLLYLLTARATLSGDDGGKQGCAIIIDTDGHFSVDRLATSMQRMLIQNRPSDSPDTINEAISQAIRHVHIFRPQSLASLTAILAALPSYLFTQERHFSFDRAVSFIAIDSASAFHWQDRAETEDAAFYAKTSGSTGPAPQSRYVALTSTLQKACTTLQCPALFTCWHLGPTSSTAVQHAERSFRPSLPAPFATLPTLRLACQRVPVKKFPPLISVEVASREAKDRLAAVEEGKFECFVNEWGVEGRTLRRMHGMGSAFDFRVREDVVGIEE